MHSTDAEHRKYRLIVFDRRGAELCRADGSFASDDVVSFLTTNGTQISDVFILAHGWQQDLSDAIGQYDRWLSVADKSIHRSAGALTVALHWPSKAWSDYELAPSYAGLLGETDDSAGDSWDLDSAVADSAERLDLQDDVGIAALRLVLSAAAEGSGNRPMGEADSLSYYLADAYHCIADFLSISSDDGVESSTWDPVIAFDAARERVESEEYLLGSAEPGGHLRDAILAPLRQLTFWHMKNRARLVGEGPAALLLRRILMATDARVHLAGHSFGTIVASGALRGGNEYPELLPRPVSSVLLAQGAVSLWAFADSPPMDVGGGRGYFADVLAPSFVSGPTVVTRSRWDLAVGRYYPLASALAREYLLDDTLPRYGGIGTFGIQGLPSAIELPPLRQGPREPDSFSSGRVFNIDASDVICRMSGFAGAHSDLAHPELLSLAWNAALSCE